MRIAANAFALLALMAGSTVVLTAAEPMEGVWKFSSAKSPSAALYESQILTITSEDGMVAVTEDNITRKGLKYRVTWRMAFDGKDYPVTGSTAGVELISGTRLGPNSIEVKAKRKDGSVFGTYWMALSTDGTLRITLAWSGADISGPPARVVIHERQ
ncbi:MAG: hypothetical protein IT167_25185 [Bryobacterales bacterium]|nr:hypothetical protein [Bryobacterales bacterium]